MESNINTMQRLAESLQTRKATFEHFDGVIFDLIEEGILEAEAGNFVRDVWDGKEVLQCDGCAEFSSNTKETEEAGIILCNDCENEEN